LASAKHVKYHLKNTLIWKNRLFLVKKICFMTRIIKPKKRLKDD
jgi:hypothetical protein